MSAGSVGSWPRAEASAPGKAFVVGEFVALRGGPAVVAALDRRVFVRVEPAPDGGWLERLDDGAPRQRSLSELLEPNASRGDLLAAVAWSLHAGGVPLPEHVVVASDRRSLLDDAGHSLGLGSSAASAVALTLALAPQLHVAGGSERSLRVALEAHRVFQGGRGSGYDVAASHRGGLCVVGAPSGEPRAERLGALAPGSAHRYELIVASGGESVQTVGVVAAVEAALERSAAARRAFDSLRASAKAAAEALGRGRLESFVDATRAFALAERALGEAAGVSIVPERVVPLLGAFASLEGVCKPSGASGDELVVAVVPLERVDEARALLRGQGFAPLAARLDPEGGRLERP